MDQNHTWYLNPHLFGSKNDLSNLHMTVYGPIGREGVASWEDHRSSCAFSLVLVGCWCTFCGINAPLVSPILKGRDTTHQGHGCGSTP